MASQARRILSSLGIFSFFSDQDDWGDVGKNRSWEGLAERFKLLDGQNIQLHPDPPYACSAGGGIFLKMLSRRRSSSIFLCR